MNFPQQIEFYRFYNSAKNPVRDSTKITDRKCGAHAVCGVFRRIASTTQPQPWIGLHRCIYLMQPTLGLVIWWIHCPPEDCAHCVRSAFPVGYFSGIPDGIFSSLLHKKRSFLCLFSTKWFATVKWR